MSAPSKWASYQFDPPWWSVLIQPYFLPRRALVRAMRRAAPSLTGRVLDVGCGAQPYRHLLCNSETVVGIELDTPQNRLRFSQVDHFYDGQRLPFADGSFNGVLCNQVLEHVFEPENFLAEIARVLNPGGILVLSVPFVWPEHERPFDSQRFTRYGLSSRLDKSGFKILSHEPLVPGAAALCALLADHINLKLSGWPLFLRLAARIVLIAPASLVGCMLQSRARKESALFLDNFITAERKDDREKPET